MKCLICDSDEVVYSGVDALVYGIGVTEKFCHQCSRAFYEISKYLKQLATLEKIVEESRQQFS